MNLIKLWKHFIVLAALSSMLVLAGCGTLTIGVEGLPARGETAPTRSENTPAPVHTVTPAPVQASPTAAGATQINPLPASCPVATQDSRLYVNYDDGYCLLYPASFKAMINTQQAGKALALLGQRTQPQPKSQDTTQVGLTITLTGPADGLDSRGYAERWLKMYAGNKDPVQANATIGKLPAVVQKNLPSMGSQRGAFVVAPDARYTLVLSPQPEDVPELAAEANKVWDSVTTSIVFFKPQGEHPYVRPEDACPKESSGQRLYTNLMDGYCLLYPDGFNADSGMAGQIKGGPLLGNVEGFGDVYPSITVGTFGYFDNQTPRQVIEPRIDVIDSASLQDATIARNPAVIFRDPRGPWASKQALIMVNGEAYTILAQPYEPQRYAKGMPALNQLWDSAIASLAFFTPWK